MKSNTIATVSAHRAAAPPKRGAIRRITIEPADNGGHTVEIEHHPHPSSGKDSGMDMSYELREKSLREKTVHESTDSAVEHIRARLGGGKKETAKHEAGESKGKEKSEGKKDKEKAG